MGPTVLFTHLKIILLECFQFSVSATINSIQTHLQQYSFESFHSEEFPLHHLSFALALSYSLYLSQTLYSNSKHSFGRNSTPLAHLQCSLYIVQNPLALCRTLIRVLHDSKCGMETTYFEFVWDAEKISDATKS